MPAVQLPELLARSIAWKHWLRVLRIKPCQDEAEGQDFGFGEAYYLSLDYGFELSNGVGIGLHVGHHDGDFAEAFNGNAEGYYDYNVSISKGGFTFMISDTDVKGGAAEGGYDNDQVKFVVSYAVDIEM